MKVKNSALFVILATAILLSVPSHGSNWGRLLGELTESGGKATVKGADEVAEAIARTRGASQAAAKEAKHVGVNHTNKAALRQAVAKAIGDQGGDPSVIRFVNGLDDPQLDTVMVYLRGSRKLKESIPDIAARAQITRDGGAPTLAALGINDSINVDDFIRINTLSSSGKIPALIGETGTLLRLGEVLSDGTRQSAAFYSRYVRGNEITWAAGGALAWWLADPDSFQDAAGNLTEQGFQKATELGGEILASALRGTAEGGKQASEEVVAAVVGGYFQGSYVWGAWLALILLIYLLGLAVPITRSYFLKPFHFLAKKFTNHDNKI